MSDFDKGLSLRAASFSKSGVMAPLVTALRVASDNSGRRLGSVDAKKVPSVRDYEPGQILLCFPATDMREAALVLRSLEAAALMLPALSTALRAAGQPFFLSVRDVVLLGFENLTGEGGGCVH